MTGQLTNTASTLPAGAGALVMPGMSVGGPHVATGPSPAPITGGGAADAASAGAQVTQLLQQMLSVVTALVATAAVQPGVLGGGGAAPVMDSAPSSGRGSVPLIGGTSGFTPLVVSSTTGGGGSADIVGGGAAAAPLVGAPAPAPVPAPAATTAGGPATGAPATTASAPQVDMRRIAGTPAPGGVIDTIIRSARADAPDALSEGAFTEITDSAGARMQVHIHGIWLQNKDRVLEGMQSGHLVPHVHGDGTVHLHDVR